ncbi:MAG: DUF1641 domain-containing protein [Alcanivorax sp.]|uniref:DUF1641 domain-containing protein n=1 Tax=Alloalcanivorax marinus TaxID=1177169 RepID=UPI001959F39D|nr:DUF1641 domain-containing protein [Alloalcanivorax marinus]MBM7333862.1 DUF1641 domain-containing protein [Alloalcanivorax marinus]
MAKAIHYEVPAPAMPDEAREELDKLLRNLHERGVLRLLNDLLGAFPEVSGILMRGINNEDSRNAIQNLSLLAMGLGRIPPERFATVTRALTEALDAMEENAGDRAPGGPGVTGTYRLLHDDDLWRGLGPLLEGIRRFGARLGEPEEKPAARRHDLE